MRLLSGLRVINKITLIHFLFINSSIIRVTTRSRTFWWDVQYKYKKCQEPIGV